MTDIPQFDVIILSPETFDQLRQEYIENNPHVAGPADRICGIPVEQISGESERQSRAFALSAETNKTVAFEFRVGELVVVNCSALMEQANPYVPKFLPKFMPLHDQQSIRW